LALKVRALATGWPSVASLDLTVLSWLYQSDAEFLRAVGEIVLERIAAYQDPAVWIYRLPREALMAQVDSVVQRRAAGEKLPLYGIPFAIKDAIDVAGYPTTAGCPAFSYVPARTAPAVQNLLNAGAIFVGKTNLDQFGSGLAGDRSPYGVCQNVFNPAYISGGSSSGSAVAVARGLVSFALGTDTAGSGRVPAGCSNIVGLKPTPGRLSTEGVVPACKSLDCLSIFALTAEDAQQIFQVANGECVPDSTSSDENASAICFAIPRDEDLEFHGDGEAADSFRQAVGRMEHLGWRRMTVDFRPFREVAGLLYEGPWLAERLASLGAFVSEHAADMHPVTREVIQGGASYSAAEYFRASYRLKELREVCLKVFSQAEVLVVPTMPTCPTQAEVEKDSRGWSRRLGYYTNSVNLLGLAAIAVPAGFKPNGLPHGITLIGPQESDERLCELGMFWQRRVNLPLGATGQLIPSFSKSPSLPRAVRSGQVRVAVAGAHLRGQPLHLALRQTGARFVRACKTAPKYRFLAFLDLDPPRPGLLRDHDRAGAIQVELYDLPLAGFGALVASVAPPLSIGTIELEDGETVKGFLCESWAAKRASDITNCGGWVAFQNQKATLKGQL
jgi:allophanate hydrolase